VLLEVVDDARQIGVPFGNQCSLCWYVFNNWCGGQNAKIYY
jgi:hypothetical protein